MDVRLPDGTVIKDVPDNMSRADLTAKLKANGYDISKLYAPSVGGNEIPQGRSDNKHQVSTAEGALLAGLGGASMGFFDELAGAISAPVKAIKEGKSLGQAYQEGRDIVRAKQKAFAEENPITSQVAGFAGGLAAAPLTPAIGVVGTASRLPGWAQTAINAATSGAVYGGIGGLGGSEATDLGGIARDVGVGSAVGATLGPVAQGIGAGIGAAKKRLGIIASPTAQEQAARRAAGQDVPQSPAEIQAQEKVAEALARDARGTVFQGQNALSPVNQQIARLNKLGDRATLADVGGAGSSTMQLLDTLATLPGSAKTMVGIEQRARAATSGKVLREAAETSLGTGGKRLPAELEALDQARSAAAKPLYDQVRATDVPVDAELRGLLERAKSAFGRIKQVAGIRGEEFTLGEKQAGVDALMLPKQGQVSLSQLDTLKRHLYDIEQGHINPETGRLDEYGNAYKDLRRQLVAKLDAMTTDPQTGQSFYKAARDAYAGPTELRAAANLGNQAMSKDAWKISDITKDMSPSEIEAFKVGAFESLNKKLGSKGGRTELMDMWQNENTREKLQALFGDERSFRQFASAVAKEGRLKALQSVGKGSQTAARLAGAEDLQEPVFADVGKLVAGAKGGSLPAVVASGKSMLNRLAMPEQVRDEMARILMTKGPQAQAELNAMRDLAQRIRVQNALSASRAGRSAGMIGSQLIAPMGSNNP